MVGRKSPGAPPLHFYKFRPREVGLLWIRGVLLKEKNATARVAFTLTLKHSFFFLLISEIILCYQVLPAFPAGVTGTQS